MLKRDVKEMVNYLIGERKSFKVTFANGKVEVVEYRGYCWVLGNKGYTDEELVKKMVRFQDNVSKFIIRLEVIEEEVEEVVVDEESSVEESLVEEVENLTDDLFQDEDLAYCEECIERESNVSRETNNIKGEVEMKEMEEIIKNKIISLKNEIDTNNIIIENKKKKLNIIKSEEEKILAEISNLEFEQLVLNKIIKKEKEKLSDLNVRLQNEGD